jgi:two-component system chemotaxis response regulator CheB
VTLDKVIVIGASAGGVEALQHLLKTVSPELPAAIVVVVHIARTSPGVLPGILARSTRLRVKRAEVGDLLSPGFVYVAPPDHHLTIVGSRLELNRGPRENRQRPAIDVLFRSAALAFGPRAIGVVLTGLLDDGTAGLAAIKKLGGTSVVQEPSEAAFPSMPLNALERVAVDHVVPLAEMGALFRNLVAAPVAAGSKSNPDLPALALEAQLARSHVMSDEGSGALGTPAPFGCPDCGGPIWQANDPQVRRYRCHLGHAFTARSMVEGQTAALERSLWASLRLLEERATIMDRMAEDERRSGRLSASGAYAHRAAESRQHAKHILELLEGSAAAHFGIAEEHGGKDRGASGELEEAQELDKAL